MTDCESAPGGTAGDNTTDGGVLTQLDRWAQQHPWHPRIAPWMLYLALMSLALPLRSWQAWTYVPLKLLQTALVCGLIWRWRHRVGELSLRFHWSVLPVSIALTALWIGLGEAMLLWWPLPATEPPSFWQSLHAEQPGLFWLAAAAHLLAMCTAVPLVEETFNRSLLLRSLHRPGPTLTGILQFLIDMPLVGDVLRRTPWGKRAAAQGPVFGVQFEQTPLGALSPFGVFASTAMFMLVHQVRDWPGAIVCGVTWCLLLSRTRHLGLGPVIWSHALVNLLLWGHVIAWQRWHFL